VELKAKLRPLYIRNCPTARTDRH